MPNSDHRWSRRPTTSGEIIVAVAVFIALFANTTFFSAAIRAFGTSAPNWPFYASLFVSLASLFVLLLSAVCHRILIKPVLTLVLVLSAGLAYFSHTYGTIFDTHMLANAIATDRAEASDLWHPMMLVWFGLLGVLPSLVVWRTRLMFPPWRVETVARLKLAGAAVLVLVLSVVPFSGHYAGLLREHGEVTSRTIPTYALLSALRVAAHAKPTADGPPRPVAEDAIRSPRDSHRELVIMVVGETARADHWGLNGYARDTTPELRKLGVLNFPQFWSCGTSTAESVPCMFSNLGHARFDAGSAHATENVLDVLSRAGVSVIWRDNNSSSKGVADRVTYQDYKSSKLNAKCDGVECRDEGMLDGLQSYIDAQSGDILIVLHQMGNHGPAYFKRYPKEFERFTPVCRTNDLGSCTTQEIHNAYDNAILYTDFFLSKVIALLKANDPNFETAIVYLSDHGESLGEYGLYLHGAPYAFAPDAQKHVPAVMWFGEGIKRDLRLDTLADRSRHRWSHDHVFATLLGLFELKTGAYRRDMDILEHSEETMSRVN
jgi:lipid A ethanolaminephosphotransferase